MRPPRPRSPSARGSTRKDWADKAQALASYAKQARNETLHKMAVRIQARAIRRCGELLKQFESQQGKRNQHTMLQEGDLPKQSREEAATDAGLSEHQRKIALRVANVAEEDLDNGNDLSNILTQGLLTNWRLLNPSRRRVHNY